MTVRKGETETQGSAVVEVRSKSAIVEIDSQSKMASSEPPYEVITQQITYLPETQVQALSNPPFHLSH